MFNKGTNNIINEIIAQFSEYICIILYFNKFQIKIIIVLIIIFCYMSNLKIFFKPKFTI